MNQKQLDFFAKGSTVLEKSPRSNPTRWLPLSGWEDILKLASDFPEKFGQLPDELRDREDEWKKVKIQNDDYSDKCINLFHERNF